jgi:hypothetical protein
VWARPVAALPGAWGRAAFGRGRRAGRVGLPGGGGGDPGVWGGRRSGGGVSGGWQRREKEESERREEKEKRVAAAVYLPSLSSARDPALGKDFFKI